MKYIIILLLLSLSAAGQQEFFHAQNKGLLLDEYPNAAAAYSLRRVNSRYTGPLIRVRRDSTGQAEQDIGSIGEALDTVALKAFIRNNSGYVTTWYDQSGNARNATQTTAAAQPRIVSAGVVDRVGNKPSALFDGSNDLFTIPNFSFTAYSIFSASIVTTNPAFFNLHTIFSKGSSTNNSRDVLMYIDFPNSQLAVQRSNASSFPTATKSLTRTNINLLTGIFTGSAITSFVNSVAGTLISTSITGTTVSGAIAIGALNQNAVNAFTYFTKGYIPEVLVYTSDQTTNRTQIEQNINSYYAIY